jgi:hypothetical protein
MPVLFSIVCTSSRGPPYANAALILVTPYPGTSTMLSRGIDIRRSGPLPVCSSMIVSVRRPSPRPVPYSSCSLRVSPSRLSEPTSRYVVPGWSDGRSSPGSVRTLSTWDHAQKGTATRKTSHRTSTSFSQPSRGRRRGGRPEVDGAGRVWRGGGGGCSGPS